MPEHWPSEHGCPSKFRPRGAFGIGAVLPLAPELKEGARGVAGEAELDSHRRRNEYWPAASALDGQSRSRGRAGDARAQERITCRGC